MKLQNKDIESLVEKYYAGVSSEEEELLLRATAAQDENFRQTTLKSQFETLKGLKNIKGLDSSFDDRIMKEIKSTNSKTKTISRFFYAASGIAATIAALFLIWFGTGFLQTPEVYATVTDPKVAFQETRLVLEDVSDKLNKGLKPAKKTVNKVDSNINQTSKVTKIKKALDKTKELQKLEKASDLLKSINKVYVDLGNS